MSKSMIPNSESKLRFRIDQHHKEGLTRKPMKLHVSERFHARIGSYAKSLGVTNSDFIEFAVDCFMSEFIRLKRDADEKRAEKIEAETDESALPDPENS